MSDRKLGEFFKNRAIALSEITVGLIAVLTVATFFGRWFYLADILTSFRHLFAVGIVPFVLFLLITSKRVSPAIGFVVLIINLGLIATSLPINSNRCEGNLTVVTFNAFGPRNNVEETVELLNDAAADVVVVTELAAALDNRLKTLFPHHVSIPDEGTAGMGVFSRSRIETYEVTSGEWFPQIDVHISSAHGPLRILAVHPPPPSSNEKAGQRNRELEQIAARMSKSNRAIIAGDLNITRQSSYFANLLEAGFLDSRRLQGVEGTWPSMIPFRVGIDHVLPSADIEVCNLDTARHIGSDHLPLVAKLRIDD